MHALILLIGGIAIVYLLKMAIYLAGLTDEEYRNLRYRDPTI